MESLYYIPSSRFYRDQAVFDQLAESIPQEVKPIYVIGVSAAPSVESLTR